MNSIVQIDMKFHSEVGTNQLEHFKVEYFQINHSNLDSLLGPKWKLTDFSVHLIFASLFS